MICTACGTLNTEGRRFCLECGAVLAAGCPACGSPNEPGAKFCGSCGSRLATIPAAGSGTVGAAPAAGGSSAGWTPASLPPAGAERRLVTVLFADLVGFTTLSADRDPEAVRELLGRYFERCREIIGRHGGIVEKFIGDAVMAVWGAPVAFEDDAERGVRAALELVDAVPVIGRDVGVELQVRAGVLSGEAAVTLGATNQGMVAGDLVNTASRLQSVAAPGTVLVGEATRAAAGSAIAFEAAGDQVLKGKVAPVPAFRAIRVVADRGGGGRSDALEPPFVGRTEELRFLKEQFHAAGRERRARVISLVGEGGIGKSRLAWELEKYLDGLVETVWWHRGRSPSYGEGVTFWALGEMIRRRAGLAEGDDEAATRRAIEAMLAQHVPSPDERAWIAPRLLVLLGVGEMPTGGREELFAAWRTFFERLATERTVALVVEDLQWADDGLLDFLEHLLDWARTHPIFVLTLARPELLERRPGWGSDRRGAISMRLEPLSTDAMRELLEGIAPGLPASAVDRILERAGGIPLYAVETVRMLVANGGLVDHDGRLVPVGDLGDLEVPPTLHALVAARLDALAPADRVLLQDAAVLGQTFALPALAALTGEPEGALAPRLADLVHRDLLTVETDPRAPTRGQHAFVQALLREVAYGTLARRDRRVRHLAAARYFEVLGDEELAGVLATHFVAAYRAAPNGPEGEAVAAQARLALLGAADRAETLGAPGQAAAAIRAALEVTADPAGQALLLERIGALESLAGRYEEAVASFEAAVAAYDALGDGVGGLRAVAREIHAHLAASRVATAGALVEGRRDSAEALAANAAALGDDPEAGAAVARFLEATANALFRAGRFDEAIDWSDRALILADPLRLDEVVAMALITKGTCLSAVNRLREGVALLHGALVDARDHGLHQPALRAGVNLSAIMGDLDPRASLARTREGMEAARHLGIRSFDTYHAGNATSAIRVGEWSWLRAAIASLLELDRDAFEADLIRSIRVGLDIWTGDADLDLVRGMLETGRAEDDFQTVGNCLSLLLNAAYAEGRDREALELGRELIAYPSGWLADISLLGRIAVGLGERDVVAACEARLAAGPGGAADVDLAVVRAAASAADGRSGEALVGFRSALSRYREMGLRFDAAIATVSMAELLPSSEGSMGTVVAEAVEEARLVADEVGAGLLLARLDRAVAETNTGPAVTGGTMTGTSPGA